MAVGRLCNESWRAITGRRTARLVLRDVTTIDCCLIWNCYIEHLYEPRCRFAVYLVFAFSLRVNVEFSNAFMKFPFLTLGRRSVTLSVGVGVRCCVDAVG